MNNEQVNNQEQNDERKEFHAICSTGLSQPGQSIHVNKEGHLVMNTWNCVDGGTQVLAFLADNWEEMVVLRDALNHFIDDHGPQKPDVDSSTTTH